MSSKLVASSLNKMSSDLHSRIEAERSSLWVEVADIILAIVDFEERYARALGITLGIAVVFVFFLFNFWCKLFDRHLFEI